MVAVVVLLLVVVERPLKQEPQLPWDDRSPLRLSEQLLLTLELGERGDRALPKVLTVALDPETLLPARRVMALWVPLLALMLKLPHQAGLMVQSHQSLPR